MAANTTVKQKMPSARTVANALASGCYLSADYLSLKSPTSPSAQAIASPFSGGSAAAGAASSGARSFEELKEGENEAGKVGGKEEGGGEEESKSYGHHMGPLPCPEAAARVAPPLIVTSKQACVRAAIKAKHASEADVVQFLERGRTVCRAMDAASSHTVRRVDWVVWVGR
jgi:hypothetical protein